MTRHFNHQPSADGHLRRWRGGLGRTARACLLMWAMGSSLLTGLSVTAADEQMPADFQVKAAFLINFPKYVDWSTNSFAETNSPITVAIFGDENVAIEVANMIGKGRMISGRPIVFKRIAREEDLNRDCHILFISASERQRIPAILEKIHGGNILTVSESDDFLEKGGVINLSRQGRKIRLQVNLIGAEKAQLKISSKLLAAADVVKGKTN